MVLCLLYQIDDVEHSGRGRRFDTVRHHEGVCKVSQAGGGLSAKYSSMVGSPSKGSGGTLAPKPYLHSSHCQM
jgi:hypothetical protein